VKTTNWLLNLIIAGALIVYEFPMVVITALFIFPLLHNAIYLRSKFIEVATSLLFFSIILVISFLFLFGTLIF
jgi:hypothetical protein